MNWFTDLFRSKITVATGSTDAFDQTVATYHGIRRGMWVAVKNSSRPVGILTALSADGTARVMLTDGKGLNRVEVDVPVISLEQCDWVEIPAPRRPAKAMADALGYRTAKRKQK